MWRKSGLEVKVSSSWLQSVSLHDETWEWNTQGIKLLPCSECECDWWGSTLCDITDWGVKHFRFEPCSKVFTTQCNATWVPLKCNREKRRKTKTMWWTMTWTKYYFNLEKITFYLQGMVSSLYLSYVEDIYRTIYALKHALKLCQV